MEEEKPRTNPLEIGGAILTYLAGVYVIITEKIPGDIGDTSDKLLTILALTVVAYLIFMAIKEGGIFIHTLGRILIIILLVFFGFNVFFGDKTDSPPVPGPEPIYLSKSHEKKPPSIQAPKYTYDRVYYHPDIKIENTIYENCVAMHPLENETAVAWFNIPEGVKFFKAKFGLAYDLVAGGTDPTYGECKGSIYRDGQIWNSFPLHIGAQSHEILVDVEGKEELRLEVDPLGSAHSDRAVWADARFE